MGKGIFIRLKEFVKKREYENKYPKRNLSYRRIEKDGNYEIDLRNFIQEKDWKLPIINGKTDDEIALKGLLWVIKKIKYRTDMLEYRTNEFWAYAYQTLYHKKGDCEDGAILLHNLLLKSGIPYWKLRLTCGDTSVGGHAYLVYYVLSEDKWVALDWCFYPNIGPVKDMPDYKDNKLYGSVWFSWNQKHCYSGGLNSKAKEIVSIKKLKREEKMTKQKSPKFSIDKVGLIKVVKGAGIAGAGAILVYLAEAIPGLDFGEATPIVVGISAIVINFVRKFIMKYE